MEASHYYKLGSIESPHGALYCIKDKDGAIQTYTEIGVVMLKANGIQVTSDIEREISSYCRISYEEFDRQVDSEGIPEKLQTLLRFTKKSKLVAYCKRITISEDELFLLVHNCSQIGFKHQSKFIEFLPESRKLLDSDISDMKQGNPRKFSSKVRSIFAERKKYNVHLFSRGNEWHCLYYTYQDMECGGKNHWALGSHLHYVSHLWPNYGKRQVWESFDRRNINIQGVHIELIVSEMDDEATNQEHNSFFNELLDKFRK